MFLSVVVSLAIAGCGACQNAVWPQTLAGNNSPCGSTSDEIPYTLVKTNEDGTRVILYYVELMVPQSCITIDDDGLEVMSTEMKPLTEERMATVPPGEDIGEFIRVSAGGRIPISEPPAAYTSGEVESASVPPAPPIPEEDRTFAVFPSR
jgi:hypothetical protein